MDLDYEEFIGAVPLTIDPFYTDNDYNAMRRLKISLLSWALQTSEEFRFLGYQKKINYMMMIENSCFNETLRKAREYNIRCTWKTKQFEDIYHSICSNLVSMLDRTQDTSSPTLIKKILNGEIELKNIAHMTCKELCPEKYEILTKEIEKRSSAEHTVKSTTMYFCRKCKKNNTTSQSIQNRSGDEGNTYLITCLFCHNKWFGG
jgi:DNA-directed RNA polymerase subunit M/transcription elongation factor TFIIS